MRRPLARTVHRTIHRAVHRTALGSLSWALLGGALLLAGPSSALSQTASTVEATAPPTAPPLLGFPADAAAEQRALEARFDALLSAGNMESWLDRMAHRPHPVGSPAGEENARWMAEQLTAWGYETEIDRYEVLFPTPRVRRLERLAPTPWTASLEEPPVEGDDASWEGALPPYNAYSAEGDVRGQLVYVNQGVPDDYEELARRGIDVAGKVVIARYGGSWRGIKPKVAAEHGAVGCILYSDPRDDGYFQGPTYPEGGWRNEHGVQRGSVSDMPLYPGDPSTPGTPSLPGAERLERSEIETLTRIPVLPISWSDAQPLLEGLEGPMAPPAWRGALPIPYRLGPGPVEVRLELAFDWNLVPAHDVIARWPGSERPDQWVLRGNHHDAWVHGAADPVSGLVSMLEEARALAELARAGHPPKRTVIYAAWDAEEPGLLGSVEWVEDHAAELREKAVAYLNTDSSSAGFLGMGGSHTLQTFLNQVIREVEDPFLDTTVAGRLDAARRAFGSPEEGAAARAGEDLPLYALGSGSDYTPFLQHLGIASLNLGFGGESDYGQYHSGYDTPAHFRRFMDPGHTYGVTLAQVNGRAVLRLANAPVLPFEFTALAATVASYLEEVQELEETLRRDTEVENDRIEAGVYPLAEDRRVTTVVPEPEGPVPHTELAALENAVDRLGASARAYDEALRVHLTSGSSLPLDKARELDRLLYTTERAMTHPDGLPGRPWFVHHLYAPGFYTGYGVKTLPGVREALELRQWDQADAQATKLAGLLDGLAAQIDRATALLSGE